jgi:glycosyltransferase involved in cell wall biosynthesis
MKNIPIVSIILPTFNRAEFLRRSIKSVLNQTYSQWELIIWDDGSVDNTKEFVESFTDTRIRYFFDENHGLSYARNRAIDNSRGIFLAFLDSDDEWRKEKLALQVEAMIAHPQIDFLFTDFQNIHIEKNDPRRAFDEYEKAMSRLEVEKLDCNLYYIKSGLAVSLMEEFFIAADSTLIKKEILEGFGYYNENLKSSVDFELCWRLLMKEIRFAYLDQVLLYRYKPTRSLSSHNKLAYDNRLLALKLCETTAISVGKPNFISLLKPQYRNTWQHLIFFYARVGDKTGMFNAFRQSLRYGLRLGSIRLLLQAILQFKYS